MLYSGYMFKITEDGLLMVDSHPDEMIMVENTPFNLGDTFVLTQTTEGNMFFRKTQQPQQIPLEIEGWEW